MSKFYTASALLGKFLTEELNFTFHKREDRRDNPEVDIEEEIKYFTHHTTGKQVKIDFKKNFVTLLDKYGYVVDESSSFTDNQIKLFINK